MTFREEPPVPHSEKTASLPRCVMATPHRGGRIETAHGGLRLPAFLPDATRGFVRSVDAEDAANAGTQGLMVNALHLSSSPGASVVADAGGIHRFTGWGGPIASDSGGFQVYSLLHGPARLASVTRRGFSYRFDPGQRSRTLTPERCARIQARLGADIAFCLDHCTHPDAPPEEQRASVDNTVEWAARFKAEMARIFEAAAGERPAPLLFAVVQGGGSRGLRAECVDRLLPLGFDGYGYGGWPTDDAGELVDMVGLVAELAPEGAPLHALGIGKPESLAAAYRLGYDLFDCVLPTRDARHKRLYAFRQGRDGAALDGKDFYEKVYIGDRRHVRDESPIEEGCDCACCRRYSRAFLHHLFRVGDPLALRLASIHNLRFYARLAGMLGERGRPQRSGG